MTRRIPVLELPQLSMLTTSASPDTCVAGFTTSSATNDDTSNSCFRGLTTSSADLWCPVGSDFGKWIRFFPLGLRPGIVVRVLGLMRFRGGGDCREISGCLLFCLDSTSDLLGVRVGRIRVFRQGANLPQPLLRARNTRNVLTSQSNVVGSTYQ